MRSGRFAGRHQFLGAANAVRRRLAQFGAILFVAAADRFAVARWPIVRTDVERAEHVGEETGVEAKQRRDGFRETAIRLELNLDGVHEHDEELNDLHCGQVFLPPEMLLHLGSHGGQHVVGVHQDVDEGVYQAHQGAVTT